MNDTLYLRCKEKNIVASHVCEVGVYLPETSNILGFIRDEIRSTLVEADPETNEKLKAYFKKNCNVRIVENAVYFENKALEFCKAEASTFVREVPMSPALANDKFNINKANTFTVQAVRFDEIDDGTIDILSIDTEGCDWYVLKNMISRPMVISIETGTKHYVNPFLREIKDWMKSHGYEIWYYDGSDTVYMKPSIFNLSLKEKVKRALRLM